MTVARPDLLLAAAAVVIAASAAHRTRAVVAMPDAPATLPVAGARTPTAAHAVAKPADDTTDYAQLVIDHDVFRIANAPSNARYSLATEALQGPPQAPVFRPQLVVKAIIGGPPWQAMIDGLPGTSATIVQAGQKLGALSVRSISRDTVVIQGADTTWRLTLRGRAP